MRSVQSRLLSIGSPVRGPNSLSDSRPRECERHLFHHFQARNSGLGGRHTRQMGNWEEIRRVRGGGVEERERESRKKYRLLFPSTYFLPILKQLQSDDQPRKKKDQSFIWWSLQGLRERKLVNRDQRSKKTILGQWSFPINLHIILFPFR